MKKKVIYLIAVILLLINIVAYNHAYQFSHFTENEQVKTSKPEELPLPAKLFILFNGISNPKPKNDKFPEQEYTVLKIATHHNLTLDAWHLKVPESKGTVLLFHGFTAKKSDLLKEAAAFNHMGYNAVLVDFYGSGDSDGNTTSVGYFEGEDVANVYKYVSTLNEDKIILFGMSMGAVAVANAVANRGIEPSAIILESPYGRLLTTVKNRFKIMGVPSLGFAELLVFWGGVQNGYWGFNLNTIEFAKLINVPTLIMHGEDDQRADLKEVQEIFEQLKSKKKLRVFANMQHEPVLNKYPEEWKKEVSDFLIE